MFCLGFLVNVQQGGEEVDKATGCDHELLCVRSHCGIQWGHWVFQRAAGDRKRGERKHGNREAAFFPLQSLSVEAVGCNIVIHFRLENLKWDLSRSANTLETRRQNKCK